MNARRIIPDLDVSSQIAEALAQLRGSAILAGLAGVLAAALAVLVRQTDNIVWQRGLVLSLIVLMLAVWSLRQKHSLIAGWLLVLGGLATTYLTTLHGGDTVVLCLLAVPIGFAMLLVGSAAGLALAALCALGLLLAPPSVLPVPPDLKIITTVLMGSTVGLIWLTLRPLLVTVEEALSHYERGQLLLREARESRLQLNQSLEELARANAQLLRLQRLAHNLQRAAEDERRIKEEFVANVSHELRTPLNMIIGFCETILKNPETYSDDIPPALLADLQVVLRNSQHLSSLVNDVLDLSQINAGRMALVKEHVPIAEIIEAAEIAVRPLFASKGLALDMRLALDLPPIFCDRTRIREVLLNLLSNAGRFTDQGRVSVRAEREGEYVVVSVADTGAGIAEEDQKKLFQPFQQLDGSIRRRVGGTGLGLAISKNFVEMHGGALWVESQKGQGTKFFFRLPIETVGPITGGLQRGINPYSTYEERAETRHLPATSVKSRVVVVERGTAMQKLLRRYLHSAEVVAVPDVEAMLQDVAASPVDAVLVNSWEVSPVLQRLGGSPDLPAGVPALICSVPDNEQAGEAMGVADYLVKPVSSERLLAALDRLPRPAQTILLVEDEPDAQQLFRRMLAAAQRGYRVLRAEDGLQGLAILRRQRVDVVLLDLTMPRMDGFQFLAALKQEPDLCNVPVILISARDPEGHPITSHALAVTRGGGLSGQQVLACLEALTRILAPLEPIAAPAPPAAPPG
jgi:signal transduction histidine kinase/DNA-binding response OmpR family regulator